MDFVDPNLRREHFGWRSPRLGVEMPIVRYGHYGHVLLLFPTSGGDFLEAERMGLIRSLEPLLFAGRVTVFCIESINSQAWMNPSLSVREKGHNQALYSGYVEEEVVPHLRRVLHDPGARIGVGGASFGAFHATNAFFRRPDLFDTLITMSGVFNLEPDFTHGYWDENLYFNNPPSFVPNLEGRPLEWIQRHSQIHLLSGRGAWEDPELTETFSRLLWNKRIWHNCDVWGHDTPHDWSAWCRQLPYYLSERVGW